MKAIRCPLNTLQDLLVAQFRAFQALAGVLESERRALGSRDEARLQALGLQKAHLLERLEYLEAARQTSLQALAKALGVGWAHDLRPAQIYPALPGDSARQLERLQQGIATLLQSLHETTLGNRALAEQALACANEQQERLVSRLEATAWKEPTGGASPLPGMLANLVEARQALAGESLAGHARAASRLELALAQFDLALDPRNPPGSPPLVEAIAGLYRQGRTYQAVLQTCDRTLDSL